MLLIGGLNGGQMKRGVRWFRLSIALGIASLLVSLGGRKAYHLYLRNRNYDRSFSARTVQGTEILNRAANWDRVEPSLKIRLRDGRNLVLAGIRSLNNAVAAEAASQTLTGVLSYSVAVGHAELTPVGEATGEFKTTVFSFSMGGGWCGNTPYYQRVPRWQDVGLSLVRRGLVLAASDASEDYRRAEYDALLYGAGIWEHPENIRKFADLDALAQKCSTVRAYEAHQIATVLLRAGHPETTSLIQQVFERGHPQELHLLALVLKAGDRSPLDAVVSKLAVPVRGGVRRVNSFEYLKRALGHRFDDWRALYRWYHKYGNQLTTDEQGWRFVIPPEVHPRNLREESYLTEYLAPLGSPLPFTLQDEWAALVNATSAVRHGERLFVVSSQCSLWEVAIEDGESRRIFPRSGRRPIPSSGAAPDWGLCEVAMLSGVVLLTTDTGRLLGFARGSWELLWERPGIISRYQKPGISKQHFLVTLDNGDLQAIDPISGELVWRTSLLADLPKSEAWKSGTPRIGPVTIDGTILARGRKKLYWIDSASGGILRESSFTFHRVTAEPVVQAGIIYTVDRGRDLVALRYEDGSLLWKTPIRYVFWPQNSTVSLTEEGLIVNEGRGLAMFSFSGELVRRITFEDTKRRPGYAISDDFIYAFVSHEKSDPPNYSAELVVLNRSDWTPIDSLFADESARKIAGPIISDGNRVYFDAPLRCVEVLDPSPASIPQGLGQRQTDP